MWKTILLCVLVALSAAEHHHHQGAWRQKTAYNYKVQTRTLAAIPNLKNQWVGLFTSVDLVIHPISQNVLVGQLYNGQQSEWHDALPVDPVKHMPEKELSYKTMEIHSSPFEIRLSEGAIHSIAVDKDMTNVQLNQLKGILSQLQVDIQARNVIDSPLIHLPLNKDNSESGQALYKVMEPTVTGKCEVYYDISRVPLYLAQSFNEYDSNIPLEKDEHFYEVFKNKNYTNCQQSIGYHFGVDVLNDWKPNTNLMGSLTKSGISRIVISGNFNKYTIRSSVTTNRVVSANPDRDAEQDSMVVSQVNVTLVSMKEVQDKPQYESVHLIDVGNLVYSYDRVMDKKNVARPKKDSSEEIDDVYTDEEEYRHVEEGHTIRMSRKNGRSRRSVDDYISNFGYDNDNDAHFDESNVNRMYRSSKSNKRHRPIDSLWTTDLPKDSSDMKRDYYQPKPSLMYAPENPFFNYFVASNMGRKPFNAQTEVEKLTKEIAQDLEDVNELPRKSTLRKFNVLSKVVRTMNAKQIEETTRSLEGNDDKLMIKVNSVYRDALVSAGTGPAVNELFHWIEEGKLWGEEAAECIAALPKTIREPTEEIQQRFFDFVKNDVVRKEWNVHTTAGIAFTRLMGQAQVNNKSSCKYYPVHSYGRLSDRDSEFILKQVIPYFVNILKNGAEQNDARKTLYAIRALGNLGHAQVPHVFEKFLTGQKRVSDFQRLAMVLALDNYIENYKLSGQEILYKLYQDKGETSDIRSVAAFKLIRTNPSVEVLQRMAELTNNEENNDIRAVVRSALLSASRLETPENEELAKKAKSAMNLIKSEQQGVQYSRTYFHDFINRQLEVAYQQQSSYLVNEDSFVPNGLFVDAIGNLGGFKRSVEFQAVVSSIKELAMAFNEKVHKTRSSDDENDEYDENYENVYMNDSPQEQTTWSAAKIMSLLNMKSYKAKQLEGQMLWNMMSSGRFFAFDKKTFDEFPETVQKIASKLRNGYEINYSKLYNQDLVTIAFPLEDGFPFTFTVNTPTVLQVTGKILARTTPDMARDVQNNNKLVIPDTVNVTAEIEAVYSVISMVTVSFTNPSTGERYTAGYDKKAQLYVPVRISSDIDVRNRDVKTKVEPLNVNKEIKVLQISSWPFTGRDNIYNVRPLTESENVKDIRVKAVHQSTYNVGEKSTGFHFRIELAQEKDSRQISIAMNQLLKQDWTSFVMFGQQATAPEHYLINVVYDGPKSLSNWVEFTVKYDKKYVNSQNSFVKNIHPRSRGQTDDGKENLAMPDTTEPNSQKRREQFLRNACADMEATNGANVFDISVQFNNNGPQYVATVSTALSKTQGKSRILIFAQQTKQKSINKTYALQVDAKYQNLDEFRQSNEEYINKLKTKINFVLTVSHDNRDELSTVRGKVFFRQSGENAIYRQEQNQYQTIHYPYVDHIDVELAMTEEPLNVLKKTLNIQDMSWYQYIPYKSLMYLTEHTEHKGQKNIVQFEVRFTPNLKLVDVTLQTPTMKTELKGLPVPQLMKYVAVVPVVSNLWDELKYEFIQHRDTCIISGDETNTFENATVKHGALKNAWYLAVHKMDEYTDMNSNDYENIHMKEKHSVSVLVRDAQQSFRHQYNRDNSESNHYTQWKNKEVLIVLHQTTKNDITLKLSPSDEESSTPRLMIDGKELDMRSKWFSTIRSTENPKKVLAHVYVKDQQDNLHGTVRGLVVETKVGQIEVKYDGMCVKIRSLGIYRNNNRGICGAYTGQESTERKSPDNKIINNDKDYAVSWAVVENDMDYSLKQQQQQIKQKQYPIVEFIYSDPVPNWKKSQKLNKEWSSNSEDWSNTDNSVRSSSNANVKFGTKHQTQFVEDTDNNRICFSKRPLPSCPEGTEANGKTIQKVDVHCRLFNDPAAQEYKSQIKRGHSLNMENYSTDAQMQFSVPRRCE